MHAQTLNVNAMHVTRRDPRNLNIDAQKGKELINFRYFPLD